MGRTFRLPILKPGVSCIAEISNEKVSCTDVCIVAAGCGLVTGAAGGLLTGAIGGLVIGAGGIWVGSGMVAGVVVWENSGPAEIAAWIPGSGAVTASTTGGCVGVTACPCRGEYSGSIGRTSGSVDASFATAGNTISSRSAGISIGSSVVIAEDSLNVLTAEASAVSDAWGTLGCKLSAACSIIGPTADAKAGSLNDGDSGSTCRNLSAGYSTTGSTDSDSKDG